LRFNAKVQVNPRIRRLEDVAKLNRADMGMLTATVDRQFTKNETRLFSTQGASGGRSWPALSPGYAKQKRSRYPGRKIMVRTRKLRDSLAKSKGAGHVAQWRLKPRAVIEVGTRIVTAAYHIKPKQGLANPLYNRNMPDRDTLQYTRRQGRQYTKLVQDYLITNKLRRVERALLAWGRR
jgi:hypothetical protein